jgi:hypothetical protein
MARPRHYWFLGVLAVLVSATAAWAADAGEKCQASKLNLAGKYGYCRSKAEAKAIKTSTPVDYSKCDAQLSGAWAAAETKAGGACPTNGDAGVRQAELIADAKRLAWRVSGAPRFLDNGDGTIFDNQTGLTWEKKSEGDNSSNLANPHDVDNAYQWAGFCSVSGAGCQPTASAAAQCAANAVNDLGACAECGAGAGTCVAMQNLWIWVAGLNSANFAGHGDWRLPTLPELRSLVDFADGTPPAVDVAFQGADCGATCTDITSILCSCTGPRSFYWTASAYVPYTNDSWVVSFEDGQQDIFQLTTLLQVRAVRSGS